MGITVDEILKELTSYGFSFEESYKIYKCLTKKQLSVLDMFEKDLAEKIGARDANLVMTRLKSMPVQANPLHSLVYNMGNPMNIEEVK